MHLKGRRCRLRAPRGTLQDHVYRQLCELILNGEIAPGQLITIQALAEAFGVSAMPVREASYAGKSVTA